MRLEEEDEQMGPDEATIRHQEEDFGRDEEAITEAESSATATRRGSA
jgi:hypothetical protein